jgi:hypothetical protein
MKTSTFINEEQLISRAIDALISRLGPVETNRFLSLMKKKGVESLKRHHQWQAKLNKEQFFETVFK